MFRGAVAALQKFFIYTIETVHNCRHGVNFRNGCEFVAVSACSPNNGIIMMAMKNTRMLSFKVIAGKIKCFEGNPSVIKLRLSLLYIYYCLFKLLNPTQLTTYIYENLSDMLW